MKCSLLVKTLWLGITFCLLHNAVQAQRTNTGGKVATDDGRNTNNPPSISYDSQGRPIPNRRSSGNDSLKRRDKFADSITIKYRFFDSTRNRLLDSSINDFTTRFPIPYWYTGLGNFGTAAQSLIFNPSLKACFATGFSAYNIYAYTIQQSKFYQTSRPYTELSYLLGSKAEQMINILHTQNKKDNLNFAFEYRFISSPGTLKNQNANHNNIRFNFFYQSNNKRYGMYGIVISNKHVSAENGGLRDVSKLSTLSLNDPYELETRLGLSGVASRNPFNNAITTGNIYKNASFLLRHYYDFGNKDSIVADSNVYKLFYTRLRLQHTLTVEKLDYRFIDNNVDSARYKSFFDVHIMNNALKTLELASKFATITNEFSVLTYPEKKNQNQFLKIGAGLQNIKGLQGTNFLKGYNIYLNGEYRNRTKNLVWDVEATTTFYINGLNAGNYEAFITLKKMLSKKAGYLSIGFENANKSPSTIYNVQNGFFVNATTGLKKENVVKLFLNYENPKQQFKVYANYFLVNNYLYFDSFFVAKQENNLFNLLHIGIEKKIKLSKKINWYIEAHLQKATGNPPINIPLLLTRNRLAFEGNFYNNLFLSTGLEIKYCTNYKPSNYSPFTGHFFYQDKFTTNNLPELNVFLHFRIKSFKAFVRLENVNAAMATGNTKYIVNVPNYSGYGMWFRTGIWWNFIN